MRKLAAVAFTLLLASPAFADGWHISSRTVGCKLQADAERILHSPPSALGDLLLAMLSIGRCFILAPGTEVVLGRGRAGDGETLAFRDTIPVRRPAETAYL